VETFLGQAGPRVIFTLDPGSSARDVRRYSAFQLEDERLLPCGTAFVVKTVGNPAPDLLLVGLRQTNNILIQGGAPPIPEDVPPEPQPQPQPQPQVQLQPLTQPEPKPEPAAGLEPEPEPKPAELASCQPPSSESPRRRGRKKRSKRTLVVPPYKHEMHYEDAKTVRNHIHECTVWAKGRPGGDVVFEEIAAEYSMPSGATEWLVTLRGTISSVGFRICVPLAYPATPPVVVDREQWTVAYLDR
jgi:hypothetical protein